MYAIRSYYASRGWNTSICAVSMPLRSYPMHGWKAHNWVHRPLNLFPVITSYSIHYTKLYEEPIATYANMSVDELSAGAHQRVVEKFCPVTDVRQEWSPFKRIWRIFCKAGFPAYLSWIRWKGFFTKSSQVLFLVRYENCCDFNHYEYIKYIIKIVTTLSAGVL